MRASGRLRAAAAASLVAALALAGCGSQKAHTHGPASARRTTVDVYASLPMQGARALQGAGVLNGIKLALAQAHYRAGRWRIRLKVRDDASAGGGAWNAYMTARNAREAATDPQAVYYIGELDSDASEVSGPILNEAGVPQVSPLSLYSGLTSTKASPVDPSGRPTFIRLAPSDIVESQQLMEEALHAGCSRLALVHDSSLDATALAAQLMARRVQYGVQIPSEATLAAVTRNTPGFLNTVKSQGDRCLMFAGLSSPGAVALMTSLAGATPRPLRLIGSDGVCTASFTNPGAGGLPAGAASLFRCLAPAANLADNELGRAFLNHYRETYAVLTPDPLAVYGYVAMQLGIDAIADLGSRGDDKEAVRGNLFATRSEPSPLGTYSVARDGSTTLSAYGIYRVGAGGVPAYCGCQ